MVNSSDLISDFVNTLHKDPRGDVEHLATPAALADWLNTNHLLEGGRATRGDLARAVELRDALRTLLLANNEVAVDTAAAWKVLDDVARRGRVELRFSAGAPELVPAAAGVPGALGRVVAAVHGADADGSWLRLNARRAEALAWAFGHPPPHPSRAWGPPCPCANRPKHRPLS